MPNAGRGVKVAIAAARGSEGAKVQLERLLETVSPLEAYGIKERAQTWLRQYEVRKEALAVDVNQK